MRSDCSGELYELLMEGPHRRSHRAQATWWGRMAELFDMRAMELADAGFPSLAANTVWLAEYHRGRAKELKG